MAEYFRNIYPHVNAVNKVITQNDKMIIFDTETTGLEEDAKIIQFSAILYQICPDNQLKEMDCLNLYINPEQKLDPVITELTGITDDQLALAKPETETAAEIFQFMNQAPLWCAQNASFDLAKIRGMAERVHIPYIKHQCIDSLTMARNVIKKENITNYKLESLTNYLVPEYLASYHDSLEDVRATGRCMEKLLSMYQSVVKPELGKDKIPISWASFWINPNQQNMRRLSVFIDRKNSGIFWDCARGCWSCKADKTSKALFHRIDLADMERQVIGKYGWKYNADCMDDLAREWGHEYYEKKKDLLKDFKKVRKEPVAAPIIDTDEKEIELD